MREVSICRYGYLLGPGAVSLQYQRQSHFPFIMHLGMFVEGKQKPKPKIHLFLISGVLLGE